MLFRFFFVDDVFLLLDEMRILVQIDDGRSLLFDERRGETNDGQRANDRLRGRKFRPHERRRRFFLRLDGQTRLTGRGVALQQVSMPGVVLRGELRLIFRAKGRSIGSVVRRLTVVNRRRTKRLGWRGRGERLAERIVAVRIRIEKNFRGERRRRLLRRLRRRRWFVVRLIEKTFLLRPDRADVRVFAVQRQIGARQNVEGEDEERQEQNEEAVEMTVDRMFEAERKRAKRMEVNR